jgi:hypothetical protein
LKTKEEIVIEIEDAMHTSYFILVTKETEHAKEDQALHCPPLFPVTGIMAIETLRGRHDPPGDSGLR